MSETTVAGRTVTLPTSIRVTRSRDGTISRTADGRTVRSVRAMWRVRWQVTETSRGHVVGEYRQEQGAEHPMVRAYEHAERLAAGDPETLAAARFCVDAMRDTAS